MFLNEIKYEMELQQSRFTGHLLTSLTVLDLLAWWFVCWIVVLATGVKSQAGP